MLERIVARTLWAMRYVVIVPVIASVVMAVEAFYLGTVDVISLLGRLASYANLATAPGAQSNARASLIGTIVRAVDIYLVAAVLLIFSLGLYELFIGRIEVAERDEVAPRLLLIRNIDDLKDRLAKVVLLILIVEFLQFALGLHPNSMLDLLYLAIGIALIGVALYLTSRH